jgi:CheY-like chemotaxis protein
LDRLLLAHNDKRFEETIAAYLSWNGFAVDRLDSSENAMARLSEREYGMFICDAYLDPHGGRRVCMGIRNSANQCVRDTRIMLVGPEPPDLETCRFRQEHRLYSITAYRRMNIWLDKIRVILFDTDREKK